ncbi:MAG: hypothetical protein ACTSWA_05650 [Candidatus Thorarchaeota archaeon]
MTEEIRIRRKIVMKTESGKEFSIEIDRSNQSSMVDAYFELESTVVIIEHIEYFRQISTENGNGYFIPDDSSLNQMKKLCLSAAASFPKTLSSKFIEETLEIPFNSYKVYATAREHESKHFLELDEDKGISFSSSGFSWLKSIL